LKIEKFIDHTLLNPEATDAQIVQLCNEAKRHGFFAVCVHPSYTSICVKELKESGVKTCVVIGFPTGAYEAEVKAFEAKMATSKGAQELDMVMNIGALKSKNHDLVFDDINAVVNSVKNKAEIKVILECCLLTKEEILNACEIAIDAGASFVKTSTGFSSGGAKLKDVRLIKEKVGERIKIKASGGIRDYKTASMMIEAGANRIGTSSGIKILKETR